MRFNLISGEGDGLGFAIRLREEGNAVRVFIKDEDAAEIGDGLVDKVGSLEDLLNGDHANDVYVFDGTGDGVVADYLREKGFAVLGDSVIADKLEKDREFGTDVMVENGIDVPQTHSFTSWDDGRDFVKKFKGRLVYKPSKSLGELSHSHVSYDAEDMLEMLDNAEDEASVERPEFELQEFLPGTCISTEMWFDSVRALPLFNHTFERKELMSDNLGPSGGCTGNIVWACDGRCPICKSGIRRIEPFLRKHSFRGMIDLNAIVNDDGLFGLEWTPRFGYDASPTLFWELLDGELGQFFSDVARGQLAPSGPHLLDDRLGAAVRVTIPPWPSEKYHAEKNIPIRGLERKDLGSTYVYNVKADEDKPSELASAGAWGIIGIFTGHGRTISGAFSGPYRLAEKLRLPDKQFRVDLKRQFEKDMDEITQLIGAQQWEVA